jgi:hypothetical protein
MVTVTVVESPAALPAVPEIAGVVLEIEPFAGLEMVTVGAAVEIVNVTGEEEPVLFAWLDWLATAV